MKRRLFVIAVLLMSFVTFAGLAKPTPVRAAIAISCAGTVVNFNGNTTFTILVTPPYPFPTFTGITGYTFTTNPSPLPFPFPPSFTATFTVTASGPWSVCLLPGLSLVSGAQNWTHFDDGRLNFGDAWETAAIYCLGDGSVKVLALAKPNWILDILAGPAEIAKVPTHPAQNTLIKAGKLTTLYRLTGGTLQVTAQGLNPKDGLYFFIFPACPVPPTK